MKTKITHLVQSPIIITKSQNYSNLDSSEMQSFPPRALDGKVQEDWARDAREGPRVLMSLRVDFGSMGLV